MTEKRDAQLLVQFSEHHVVPLGTVNDVPYSEAGELAAGWMLVVADELRLIAAQLVEATVSEITGEAPNVRAEDEGLTGRMIEAGAHALAGFDWGPKSESRRTQCRIQARRVLLAALAANREAS